jgi:hypothetical protein
MPAGDILKGKDLRITVGTGQIYHATECNFSTNRNFDEVATKDTDGNITTPDTLTWNLSTSALVANKPDPTSQIDVKDIFTDYLAKRKWMLNLPLLRQGILLSAVKLLSKA